MVAFDLLEEKIEYMRVGLKYFYELTKEGREKGKELWAASSSEGTESIQQAARLASTYNARTLDELLPEAYAVAETEGIL